MLQTRPQQQAAGARSGCGVLPALQGDGQGINPTDRREMTIEQASMRHIVLSGMQATVRIRAVGAITAHIIPKKSIAGPVRWNSGYCGGGFKGKRTTWFGYW